MGSLKNLLSDAHFINLKNISHLIRQYSFLDPIFAVISPIEPSDSDYM
jgi:hypothetical protein